MKKIFKGFLFGSILGGVSSLFLAKSSGKDTRDTLKQSLHETVEPSKSVISSINTLTSAAHTVQENLPLLQQTASELQERFRHFSEDTQPRIKRIKQQLETIQKHFKK